MRQPDVKDWSWLGILVVLWGSAFALISVSLRDFTPLQVVNARLWIGALVLLILMKGRGQETPRDGKTWSFFLAMAVLGNALPFFLISWGQQEVASGVTGILMAIMPLIVLPLAHFLVPDEGMTVTRLIGFTLGFAGIVFLTGPEVLREFNGQGTALWSQIAILSGAVCYAFNLIIARKAPPHEPLVTAAWVLVLSACLSSVALWIDGDILPERPSLTPTIALVALGVLSTGIATEVYFRVVTRAGATFLSLINYLIPIFAVLVGAVFLGEHIPVSSLIALVIILAGVVISQRSKPATRGTEG
jgi:drug/metabolite transporter (DMT)-like permease